jgi:hypothetical protein
MVTLRERILRVLFDEPGLWMYQIAKRLCYNPSHADHVNRELKKLTGEELLMSKSEGRKIRYYITEHGVFESGMFSKKNLWRSLPKH